MQSTCSITCDVNLSLQFCILDCQFYFPLWVVKMRKIYSQPSIALVELRGLPFLLYMLWLGSFSLTLLPPHYDFLFLIHQLNKWSELLSLYLLSISFILQVTLVTGFFNVVTIVTSTSFLLLEKSGTCLLRHTFHNKGPNISQMCLKCGSVGCDSFGLKRPFHNGCLKPLETTYIYNTSQNRI